MKTRNVLFAAIVATAFAAPAFAQDASIEQQARDAQVAAQQAEQAAETAEASAQAAETAATEADYASDAVNEAVDTQAGEEPTTQVEEEEEDPA